MLRALPRLVYCCLLVFPLALLAQETQPLVWGRIPPQDLAMRYYPDDPSAPALVLGDELIVGFFIDNNTVALRSERHRRIKYFERYAYAKDPVAIEWYEPVENISRLRARLQLPDGEVIKLGKRDFRVEALGQGWSQYILDIADVPPGAVLEYSYRLSSESLEELPLFYFQEQYPVRRKAFFATIPDWFKYLTLAEPAEEYLVTRRLGKYSAVLPIPYSGVRSVTGLNELELVAEWLPPIPQEPMTNNVFDYIPQIRLRLYSVNWPNEEPRVVHKSWEEMAAQLRADTTFGGRYLRRDTLGSPAWTLPPAVTAEPDPLARARAAYRYLNDRLSWTGQYAAWTDRGLPEIWAAGEGHSGELNLLLLAILRELRIEAYPVLLRIRDEGVPIESLALLEQFSHLVVLAQLGDRIYFLDLGDPSRPIGLPRAAALNHRGWLVTDEEQSWIGLPVLPSRQEVRAELRLDSTGQSRGTVTAELTGYYAAYARQRLAQSEELEEGPLIDVLQRYYPGTESLDRTVNQAAAIAKELRIAIDCRIPLGQWEEDRLYVTPILFPALDPTLVTMAERQFPLDTPFPWMEHFVLTLDLPPGYTVESLPEPVELQSPDGKINYSYRIEQTGSRLTLDYRLAITRTLYSAQEFNTDLRDILDAAIERQEGVLVLRRTR